MERYKVVNSGSGGLVWFAGWLFTIGYMKLSVWPAIIALFIWPYHLGVIVAGLHH
jgi:hypothetical protein